MSRITSILVVFLLCIGLCACSSNNGSTAKAIVNELCSSKYQGRISGSEGNVKAAEYIADFFEKHGLEPFFDSYYHEFEGTVLKPELSQSQVAIISPDGKKTMLKSGYDYIHSLPIKDIDFTLPVSDNADECKDGAKAFITSDVASASKLISQWILAY